jgi:short-subunit dehydrogenase
VAFPFNSMYHATKWAVEGWSESMAFELKQFGIGIKTIEPGGIRTDFFSRSLDTGRHPAYDVLANKFMGMITDPKQMETFSSPEQIAEVVYEAATDGKDQLRYIAGADAKAIYETRMKVGDEAFRKAIAKRFLASQKRLSGKFAGEPCACCYLDSLASRCRSGVRGLGGFALASAGWRHRHKAAALA